VKRTRFAILFISLLGLVTGSQFCGAALALDVNSILPSVVSVLPQMPPGTGNAREPEGSGVVILDGTKIITASHVLGRTNNILIRTHDGRILKARLKGRDLATDLALLEIDEPLIALKFGGEAKLGNRACAIGNNFGFGLTVTCGVVSGIHKAGMGFNPVEDFVQTDAAVNPGGSGGALVDDNGSLIGILSAIFAKTSDTNIGMNFAVSAPLAKRVALDLNTKGHARRKPSGLRLARFPTKGDIGTEAAIVVRVRPGLPAALAGIVVGDKIIMVAGRKVRKPADFVSALALSPSGADVEIKLHPPGGGPVTIRILKFKNK
jgi:S1-C subfamily serine protease